MTITDPQTESAIIERVAEAYISRLDQCPMDQISLIPLKQAAAMCLITPKALALRVPIVRVSPRLRAVAYSEILKHQAERTERKKR